MHLPTPEQIASYRENGFLIVPDFFTSTETDVWASSVTEAVNARVNTPPESLALSIDEDEYRKALSVNMGNKDGYYQNVFIQALNLSLTHRGVSELVRDWRLGRFAAHLADLTGVHIYVDQALYKQAHGNPTAWHLDNPYGSFHTRDALTMWIALDDATVENGCLWYLPGTHRTANHAKNVDVTPSFGALFDQYPEWRTIEPVPAPGQAGTAVFHNGLIAHAAGPNMTPRMRRAMTITYMPQGVEYNGYPDMFSSVHAARLEREHQIFDGPETPLVWSAV